MKALVVEGPGSISLREVEIPASAGECLIRVTTAGICGTDLQILDGYADFHGVPGHEFVGVVESTPSTSDTAWIGQRVVADINIGCRRCERCAAGVKEHCANRKVVGIRGHDGAFAEYVTVPIENLHAVPDAIDDRTAVFVEPVAAACRILEQLALDDHSRIAVVGDGRLGLLIGQVLRTITPHVVVLGRHPEKLEIARALDLRIGDGKQDVGRFDVVVDATGRPEGIHRALELVRPRGTVVMKSTFHGEATVQSWPIVVNEVTIVGSRCGPFHRAIELLASGVVRTAPLVSAVMTFDQYQMAFEWARRSLKVLFAVQPESV
jgi:2-desacetyl-2-hydroxyethyl bacteriochlorophyllide A dehydrogenase